MEITRTTDILVETKRRIIVRQPPADTLFFCEQCAGQMVTAEISADLSGISRRAVYRLIEEQTIHFSETEIGVIFVCPATPPSPIRSGFTAFSNGRLCVSAMQTAANFWNAVTMCKNMSARVGGSADVMLTFSDTSFNYFGGLTTGWLADHIGDDTWATWNVTSPNSNFDGVSQPAGSTILPFRCVY